MAQCMAAVTQRNGRSVLHARKSPAAADAAAAVGGGAGAAAAQFSAAAAAEQVGCSKTFVSDRWMESDNEKLFSFSNIKLLASRCEQTHKM